MVSSECKLICCLCLAQALIAAVTKTAEEDIRDALKTQTEHQLALVPREPKLVRDTVAYNTTINTDDTVRLVLVNYNNLRERKILNHFNDRLVTGRASSAATGRHDRDRDAAHERARTTLRRGTRQGRGIA